MYIDTIKSVTIYSNKIYYKLQRNKFNRLSRSTHVTNDNLLGAEIWYLNTQHKNTEQIDARLR